MGIQAADNSMWGLEAMGIGSRGLRARKIENMENRCPY